MFHFVTLVETSLLVNRYVQVRIIAVVKAKQGRWMARKLAANLELIEADYDVVYCTPGNIPYSLPMLQRSFRVDDDMLT